MKRLIIIALTLILTLAMSATALAATGLSKSDASKKALKNAHLKKSQVKKLTTKYDRGDQTYKIEFVKKKNKAQYKYQIAPKSGKIIERSIEYKYKHNCSHSKIGKKKALNKAVKYSGFDASLVKKGTCKYEYDDNEGTYEVKFRRGHYKYEINMLAPTGRVIKCECEYLPD